MKGEQARTKNGGLTRTLKVGLLVLLLALVGAGLFNRPLIRLYHVITLFHPDRAVENFRSMDRMFDYRAVHRGGTPLVFERAPDSLPLIYTHNDRASTVKEFLENTRTTGLIVIHDNRVVFEKYYLGNTEASRWISWSITMSFVSALLGIALEEGHVEDILDPVTRYVPFLKGSGYDGVSIKHLLEMSAGIHFDENYAAFFSDINRMGRAIALNRSMDDFIASLKNERKPGTYRRYVSTDIQALGMVLREATGRSLSSYLEEKIWKRIGMESDAYWIVDSDGMELAFGGLNMILRDYARFGLLYLHGGHWNDRRIIPSDWVRDSVTLDAPHLRQGDSPASNHPLGYGYQWWIPEDSEGDFLAMGIYNQFIYVHPGHKVVIAKTSAYEDYYADGREKELESVSLFRAIAGHYDAEEEPAYGPLPGGGDRPPWGLLMTRKRQPG